MRVRLLHMRILVAYGLTSCLGGALFGMTHAHKFSWLECGLVYFVERKNPLPTPTPYSCFWVVYLVVSVHAGEYVWIYM